MDVGPKPAVLDRRKAGIIHPASTNQGQCRSMHRIAPKAGTGPAPDAPSFMMRRFAGFVEAEQQCNLGTVKSARDRHANDFYDGRRAVLRCSKQAGCPLPHFEQSKSVRGFQPAAGQTAFERLDFHIGNRLFPNHHLVLSRKYKALPAFRLTCLEFLINEKP